jgi:hypothetical protein
VARVAALTLVVLGHLSLAVIDRGADGAIRGANALALHPRLGWLTVAAPMPVFFAAAGWANATASLGTAARRLRTVVGLGAVVVVAWSTASVVELLIRGEGGIVSDGARIATQPLWFLAAYVPFAAAGSHLARLARRPLLTVGCAVVVLAGIDLARFRFHAPKGIGWPGFFLAWGVPWLLGAWWRSRWERDARPEWRIGAALAVGAGTAAVLLVHLAGYAPGLIDAVPGARSNTTPPTLYTAVAATAQVGVLMIVAPLLDRAAARWRCGVDRAGTAAVGVYLWHLTALALCVALLAAGLWTPTRFSTAWWLTRPAWFALVLGVTGGFVAVTSTARHRLRAGAAEPARDRSRPPWLGIAFATAGAAVVGVVGPRTLPASIASIAGFVAGWWLLRDRPSHPARG